MFRGFILVCCSDSKTKRCSDGCVLLSQSVFIIELYLLEARDLRGLKAFASLTPSKSLAGIKAIWGAAESLINRITLSSSTLRDSDCRAFCLLLPKFWLDLLVFHPPNPGLHDWLWLKAPHARGGNQKHCGIEKKKRAIKDHLLITLNCTLRKATGWNEVKQEKKKYQTKRKGKSLVSLCDPRRQKNKLHVCITALRVKIGIWTHSALFECVHVDIGSISSHMRAREVQGPTFQPFILVSFVFRYACVSWVELTVIIPNSIIFIYATGLRIVHLLGVSQVWMELQPDAEIKA